MKRKRVTGRFYIFLILVLIGLFFVLRELMPTASREGVVTLASAAYTRSVDMIVVRDEAISAFEGTGRVVYVAKEGAQVHTGDEICRVYSAGYSEKEMAKLETVRQSIRSYHEQILDNIVDKSLEQLEANVQSSALMLKTLINNKSGGSLLTLEAQLEEAMVARQDYLRQNRREDPKLNQLYEEETKRISAIGSWETVEKSTKNGIVSFYLDGCESFLTPDTVAKVSIEDFRQILDGKIPDSTQNSRLVTSVFRVVSTDKWVIVLLSKDLNWNPVNGQQISFQIDDYDEYVFSGTVTEMRKTETDVVALLEVTGSVEPLLNKRYGKAEIGVNLQGMSVPVGAITTQNGQTGVWLSDYTGGTFIPVEVLSRDSHYALVQPLVADTLTVGQRVLIQ